MRLLWIQRLSFTSSARSVLPAGVWPDRESHGPTREVYNIVGVGNLIGPQVYITTNGAAYILFGFGKKQGSFLLLSPWVYGEALLM